MVGVVAVTLGDLIGRRRVWGMSTLCHDNKNEKNQRWGNRSTLYNEINIILIPTIWNHATSIKINIIKIHQIHVVVLGASGPLWRLRPRSLCHFTCKKSKSITEFLPFNGVKLSHESCTPWKFYICNCRLEVWKMIFLFN